MAYTGKNKPTGAKSNANRIYRDTRLAAALELRLRGTKLEEIADRLGYDSRSHVYIDIDRGLTFAIREPAEKVKALELMRLDALLNSFWDAAMGVEDSVLDVDVLMPDGNIIPAGTLVKGQGPDDKAAAVILKIMERRAKLEGLDVARNSKIEVSGSVTQVPGPPTNSQDLIDYGSKLMMALNIAGALHLPIPDRVKALTGSRNVLELGVLPSDTQVIGAMPTGSSNE